jgi:hypothetical protein
MSQSVSLDLRPLTFALVLFMTTQPRWTWAVEIPQACGLPTTSSSACVDLNWWYLATPVHTQNGARRIPVDAPHSP